MKIAWTEPALMDLERLGDYIALDQPVYARDFIERLMSSVEPLIEFPLMGRVVPEARRKNVREVIFQGYRILYRAIDDRKIIEIITVIHGARDLGNTENQPNEMQ